YFLQSLYSDLSIIKIFGRIFFYGNRDHIFRQNLFDQLGPLNKADPFPEKIVVISDLFHFLNISDPIYIKVIKRKSPPFIFLKDRKRRAVYRFPDSQPAGNPLGKHSFPYSQVSV